MIQIADPLRSLAILSSGTQGGTQSGLVDQLTYNTISTRGSQIDPKLLAVTVSGC